MIKPADGCTALLLTAGDSVDDGDLARWESDFMDTDSGTEHRKLCAFVCVRWGSLQ